MGDLDGGDVGALVGCGFVAAEGAGEGVGVDGLEAAVRVVGAGFDVELRVGSKRLDSCPAGCLRVRRLG